MVFKENGNMIAHILKGNGTKQKNVSPGQIGKNWNRKSMWKMCMP